MPVNVPDRFLRNEYLVMKKKQIDKNITVL